MNIEVLWLKAAPKKAYIEFTKMTKLQKETQYKELHLEGIIFDNKSAKWLLQSLVNVEKLEVYDCLMENLDFYKHVSKLPKLESLGKSFLLNSGVKLIL